jgi:hypothetical protein
MARLLLLLAFAVSVVACGGSAEPVVETQGIVQYQNLETGWWYIEADSGVMYTPFPLPDEFQVAGLRVQASLVLLKDTASFFPGTYVRIVSIEKLAGAAGGN